MSEASKLTTLPLWVWHKSLACVVRVISTGHFPTTVMIRLPDDRVVETDLDNLEIQ